MSTISREEIENLRKLRWERKKISEFDWEEGSSATITLHCCNSGRCYLDEPSIAAAFAKTQRVRAIGYLKSANFSTSPRYRGWSDYFWIETNAPVTSFYLRAYGPNSDQFDNFGTASPEAWFNPRGEKNNN